MPQMIEGVSHIDTTELHDLLESNKDVYIIDVREPDEYTEGHIAGVPLIPMGDIPNVAGELDPSAEYVFICRSGRRSFEVAKFLQKQGFAHVHNYAGGMLAWDDEMTAGPEHVIEDEISMDKLKRK